MAGISIDIERRVIPRWRTLDETLALQELDSVAPPNGHQKAQSDFLAQKMLDWRRHRSVGHAADLVGTALTLGRWREVIGAAEFLLRDDINASPWARELAEQIVQAPSHVVRPPQTPVAIGTSAIREQARILRHMLHVESRDSISWVELSRVYTILGLNKQAERCMTIGLQLAKNNRFVLRSACRLWIHLGDPEKSHEIIVKADRTRYDPWLLAAEIAVGSVEKRRPKFVKIARKMLSERRFARAHMSELASAVATLDLESGSVKKSRQLFNLSLIEPTENSLAQAAWASSRPHSAIRLEHQHLELINAFEAEYRVYYQESAWKRAVEQCELWQFDQPFSSEPSVHGSYVAAVAQEDYEASERIAQRGLMANPKDFKLLNNLAFARINLNNFKGAQEALSRIQRSKLSDRDCIVLKATQGLLGFRTGNVKRGRQLYLEAKSMARRMPNQVRILLLALVTTFHAIEESTQTESHFDQVLREASRALKQSRDPIFRVLEDRLMKRKAKIQDAT